jgi:hypothetical protein
MLCCSDLLLIHVIANVSEEQTACTFRAEFCSQDGGGLWYQWDEKGHNRNSTNYIKVSPSVEADISSSIQESSRILWNLKVYHGFHKSPPRVPVLRQIFMLFHPINLRSYSILYSQIALCSQVASLLHVFLSEFCLHLSFPRARHTLRFYKICNESKYAGTT